MWVEGHLAELAPAGLGAPGEASMPAYLLDRGERAVEQLDATSSGGESSGSSSDDEDEDEERRAERRQEREREQNEAKAKRAREAAEWDAAHGAEREAQHAALSAEQPDFYWALACEIGRRPKWQLRKGASRLLGGGRDACHGAGRAAAILSRVPLFSP